MATQAADWAEVERLFCLTADLPAAERAPLLADAPPAVRAEVESLLDADPQAATFFERPTGLAPLSDYCASAPGADLVGGAQVGPWEIEHEVGRGGMGTVYRARRADGVFQRSVALKVVKRGMDTDEIVRRFVRERSVLAGLHHPSIARLYDGGTTADGRPYFAMELVEGEPLGDYADGRRLGVDDRLRLFLKVCDAVSYAHRNLVVHRDLKPSNVLVTPDGAPKLLDFGLARLLDSAADGADLTGEGRQLLTPDFAAPEQFDGRPATTATDVYALGVVLYDLLTGHRPFPSGEPRAPEPPRPSAAVLSTAPPRAASDGAEAPSPSDYATNRGSTPDRLARRLKGDLDAIVLKALRHEPEARYPSVDALADDVRRHLTGLPVAARRGTQRYRAGRFIRRHRWGVSVGALLAVVVVASAVSAALQHRATARERAKAEATAGFLRDVLAEANALQTGRGDVTVAEVLDEAARRVPGEFARQPDVQAALLLTIGDAYAGLSRYREAEPVLHLALALQRRLYPGDHEDTRTALAVLGVVVGERGALDSAAALQREALGMSRRLHGPRSLQTAQVMNNLAWIELQQTDYPEAERLLRESIALTGGPTPDSAAALDAARARSSLAILRMRTGRYEEAERLEAEALSLRERFLGPRHPLVALSLSNLAKVIEDSGRHLDRALPYADRALTLRRQISGDSSVAVLTSRSNRSAVLRGLGRHAEAVAEARTATSTAHALFGEGHTATAYARYNLALALHAAGDREGARREYAGALASHEAIWGRDHPYTAYVLVPYAKLALEAGDAAEAERLVRPAVQARRAALAPGSWLTADAEATLGRVLLAQGRTDQARVLLARSVRDLRQSRGDAACPSRLAAAALAAAESGRAAPPVVCV